MSCSADTFERPIFASVAVCTAVLVAFPSLALGLGAAFGFAIADALGVALGLGLGLGLWVTLGAALGLDLGLGFGPALGLGLGLGVVRLCGLGFPEIPSFPRMNAARPSCRHIASHASQKFPPTVSFTLSDSWTVAHLCCFDLHVTFFFLTFWESKSHFSTSERTAFQKPSSFFPGVRPFEG